MPNHRLVIVLVVLLAAVVACTSEAQAASCIGSYPYIGIAQTQCSIPAGITALDLHAIGGSGGGVGGGSGADVAVTGVPVSAGETLLISVAGNGGVPDGGWPWGNRGGGMTFGFGGGGGGASEVQVVGGGDLIVAGGGGAGAGYNGRPGGHGGTYFDYSPFSEFFGDGQSIGSAYGGEAGSQQRGGGGGAGPGCAGSGFAAGPGMFGGWGGTGPESGGGGGGGYNGGGGGAGNCNGPAAGGGAGYSLGTTVDLPPGVPAPPAQVDITAPVPSLNGPPGIRGIPRQGETLTETHGAWTNAPTGYSYAWFRCDATGVNCSAIPSATGQTYQLDAADISSRLKVTEIATNGYGMSAPASSTATAPVAVGTPANTSPPRIDGSTIEGQTLTASEDSWTNSPFGFSYQWSRCDASGAQCYAVPGATGPSYVLGQSDVGFTISVSEIAYNSYGSSTHATSQVTPPVASAVPVNVTPPVITGATVEGRQLSVQLGAWSNAPTALVTQWLRCNASGTSCAPLIGQTGVNYALTLADVGHTMEVQETATNWFGSRTAASVVTAPVVDAPLTLQPFALVATVRSVLPGPVASFVGDQALPASAYSATVGWGDGSTGSAKVVANPAGGYFVNATHVYRHAGSYTLTVNVTSSTGSSARGSNRVSVFADTVCPDRSKTAQRNCLGAIEFPAGCVLRGDRLRVAIPASDDAIARVDYRIDHGHHQIRGTGPNFRAALPTTGLGSGTHELTAKIMFRAGRQRAISKRRLFAVC